MTTTLFIGLDGATFTVLDDLTTPDKNGEVVMPFMRKIYENGVRSKLLSTPNPLTPPSWVSIMTGRSPGHHGILDFLRADERDGEIYFTLPDARDVRNEMIWSIATRQDKSVVSLNFPITAPPKEINGSLVPGFVPWRHLRRNVTPADLFDRLKKMPGFEPKELAWDFEQESKAVQELSEQDTENWVTYHTTRERQWFQIAEKLLVEDEPDLMAVMFDGTDKIQHQAWQFLDPELVDNDQSDWAKRMIGHCKEYFQELDAAIEKLVNLAGPDAQVFLASDHGFAGSIIQVKINAILCELGYLGWKEADDSASGARREKAWFANLDWKKTIAYCQTPSSNGITIRIASRPGMPGVKPSEYEAFRDKLIQDLYTITDDEGKPVFTNIQKREDAYPGPCMREAPDLLLELSDFGFVSITDGPTVEKRPIPLGTHHPEGIFMGYGKGFEKNKFADSCYVWDIPAMLLHSMGLPVPKDFEGAVPSQMFTPEFLAANPVVTGPETESVDDNSAKDEKMSKEEQENLLKQLELLGYME
ncbi:MAG: alkaline phosphatase family protein [Pseudomonadota bacterium]